jgi:hypothetical protein
MIWLLLNEMLAQEVAFREKWGLGTNISAEKVFILFNILSSGNFSCKMGIKRLKNVGIRQGNELLEPCPSQAPVPHTCNPSYSGG